MADRRRRFVDVCGATGFGILHHVEGIDHDCPRERSRPVGDASFRDELRERPQHEGPPSRRPFRGVYARRSSRGAAGTDSVSATPC
jgi:hypothetical protein